MTILEKWNSSGWHQEYDEARRDTHIMERHYVNMLTNMHQAPAEWTFCDEHKYVLKPANDRTATVIADGPENGQNCYSYTFLTFKIWTVLSFSLLVVQKHHKNTLDLHWSGAWPNKLKGCPNIWPHNQVRQNTSTNQPKTLKPQYNMLVFGGRREFNVVSFLLKNVWEQISSIQNV